MDESLERLAPGWVGGSLQMLGGVAQRNRFAQNKLLGYTEHTLGLGRGRPGVTRTGKVANGRTDALCGGCKQKALGQPALVVCIEIGTLWMDDYGDPHSRCRKMSGIRAIDGR